MTSLMCQVIKPCTVLQFDITVCPSISGGSSGSKLGISGDSAGGRIAAVVCHEVKGHIDFAVSSLFMNIYISDHVTNEMTQLVFDIGCS